MPTRRASGALGFGLQCATLKESKGDREIIDPIFRSKYHEGKFSEATDDYRNWTVEITLNDLRESGETISFDILYK